MKKLITLSLALLMLLICASCGSSGTAAPSATPSGTVVILTPPPKDDGAASAEVAAAPDISSVPSPTPSAEPTATPAPDYRDAYAGIIELYSRAVHEGWGVDDCFSNGVNYLIPTAAQYGSVGYCFRDVDASGIPELFIGSIGQNEIYAAYTLMSGEPVQFIDAGERSTYCLEPDDVFVNRGASSAFLAEYRIVHLSGSKLVLNCALVSDYSYDENNPWFLSYDEDGDVSNDQKMSNGSAETALAAYEANYVSLPYEAF